MTWILTLSTAIAVPAVAASSPNVPGPPEKGNPAITNPAASNPTASNPAASNPTASNPAAYNPTASNSIASNSTASNPAASNPTASNPAAYNPTASNSIASNSTASNPAAPPVFSRQGGFFTSEFFLQIVSGFPDAEIRYTLDGSEPGPDSRLYEGPILVRDRSKDPGAISHIRTTAPGRITMFGFQWKPPQGDNFRGSVVRARVFRPGHAPSEIITQSYFIDPSAGSRYTLPVVSIVTDSLHLFDYDTGIYVTGRVYDEQDVDDLENCDDCHRTGNYSQTGREWERPASMELFDKQGDRVYQQNIGIRIHGGASRALPMKSLRLYARSDYGQSRFHFPIFPDEPYTNFNRLILRNSGQDFFVRSTMFRDAFTQELVRDLNFDTQAYQPAIIFINGEYWGIQNFRERYDENYLARVWGVNPDRVDMLTDTLEVKAGSGEHYDALIRLVEENDPADPEIYRQILTMMDPDNFSDYLAAQVLVRNFDWPGNNFDLWRLQVPYDPGAPPGHDGRWRWKLVDTDAGFGLLNPWRVASYDMIRHMTNATYDAWPNYAWSTILIRAMLRNEGFRLDFINRMSDYLNTWFQPSHVTALIDRFEDRLEPVIEDHILRWGQIESMPRWHENVEWMRDFAHRRPPYVYEHMMRHFELSRPVTIEVDVSAMHKGRVEVNRITINEDTPGLLAPESPWPWRGKYFREVPVRLTAVAYSGYKFSHWEDGGTSGAGSGFETVSASISGSITGSGASSVTSSGTGSGRRLQQVLASDEDIARMLAFYGGEAHGSSGGIAHGSTGGMQAYSGGEVLGSAGGEKHGSTGGTQAYSFGVQAANANNQAASANNLDNSTIWVMPDKGLSARAVFVPKPETPDTNGSDSSGSDSSHVRPEFDFEPHRLADAPYFFIQWDPQAEPGSFPPNMIFQYMEDEDPGLGSPPAGLTSGAFNLSSRTRINGLGNDGISFINTSNRDGNPGYPGRRLGAAVLAIDTRDMKNIWVNWTGGTVTPNSRMYHLRLQFRTHPNDPFRDVRDADGRVVEYKRHATAGHSERFYLVRLPASADNKPRVELRWKYYYTGSQLTDDSGARDQLRLGDIQVRGEPMREHQGEPVENYRMLSNYPNPFNNATMIQVQLPEETRVTIHVFDINGRLVRVVRDNMRLPAGHHAIYFNAAGLAGGVYVYRVSTPDFTAHGKMTLIP